MHVDTRTATVSAAPWLSDGRTRQGISPANRSGRAPAVPVPPGCSGEEDGETLWNEHGWALGAHHVGLIVLIVLLAAALGGVSRFFGLG